MFWKALHTLNRSDENILDEYQVKLNVQRVALIAKLVLFFQLFNLSCQPLYTLHYLQLGLICTVLISVGYLIVHTIVKKRGRATLSQLRLMYQSYWLLFAVCMTPFLMMDILYTHEPVNLILYYCTLAIIPIFTTHENIALFGVLTLYVFSLSWILKADYSYFIAILVFSISALLLSFYMHKGYNDIILKLRSQTDIDDLTKLYNKRSGLEQMEIMLALCKRHCRPCAAYIVDIDYFKGYNDTYGHFEGDAALVKVAGCIRNCFGRGSDIVCRLGGEEFGVLISATSRETVIALAQKLLLCIDALGLSAGNKTCHEQLTVSVGISMLTPREENGGVKSATLMELLREADRQLYVAKNDGRNRAALEDRTFYCQTPISEIVDDAHPKAVPADSAVSGADSQPSASNLKSE